MPAKQRQAAVAVGSEQHKELFCRLLLDTFDPYHPAAIPWPRLSAALEARLVNLPFWGTAVETEENAGARMQALADATADPLIREAVALNAFEERRHKDVIGQMMRFYGIALKGAAHPASFRHPRWAFLRTGYGECFDSFFAFGLFALGRESGFLPPELVDVFEAVIQEEARHNLFFVNWVAYERARRGWPRRSGFALECVAALVVQIAKRLRTAGAAHGDHFTHKGGAALGIDFALRDFLALCIAENERRLSPYDPRLLRPRLMPAAGRLALRLLRGGALPR